MCAESSGKEAVATGRNPTCGYFSITKSCSEKCAKITISGAFQAVLAALEHKSHAQKQPEKVPSLCNKGPAALPKRKSSQVFDCRKRAQKPLSTPRKWALWMP